MTIKVTKSRPSRQFKTYLDIKYRQITIKDQTLHDLIAEFTNYLEKRLSPLPSIRIRNVQKCKTNTPDRVAKEVRAQAPNIQTGFQLAKPLTEEY